MNPNNQNLETMGQSFYEFLASAGNLIPVIFALLSLVICLKTGVNIWLMVQSENDGFTGHGEQTVYGQVIAFVFGALLGISAVVTYALSSMWG
ncbi:hypothetical protein G3A56_27795 (plasmid) [Rhizobium oryzihabitans]|jgi:hypothetical protein|uniref:Uncharacterized protein n=1 Tax=Rhizobium oryzihabitans TaxID=2267833 RepID=A0A7L5BRP4_9HYPH|nr:MULTISPECIES: hypothetical protein [Rhizobiaceae]MCT6838603.1 hypothetical protein [Bifidobacteriales bacterium]QIB41599.1 hypothetical protein G3A56_27795 [Rhizobium oryzihabitans]TAA54312.1 hypothetical protein EXZ48_26980 [Shinella sp. JR1-6]WPE24056.1 hypothetical protein ShzoTeo12_52760 [Shinella zoogloeoides]